MEKLSNALSNFGNLMDQNIRGVQIGCYSVAVIGLTLALRKVRPFSKFKRPSDIPNHFIMEKRELSGIVKGIEPKGPVLLVQHKPLVDIPIIANGKLPVKISGVRVSSLGINWLQAIVVGSEVKFIPLEKHKDFVNCQVLIPQVTKGKREKLVNVGESLVKIGFGDVDIEKPLEDPGIKKYYSKLELANIYAQKRKLGLKYYIKPSKHALKQSYKSLSQLANFVSKQFPKVPKLLTS